MNKKEFVESLLKGIQDQSLAVIKLVRHVQSVDNGSKIQDSIEALDEALLSLSTVRVNLRLLANHFQTFGEAEEVLTEK
jgi:hypothetical protein